MTLKITLLVTLGLFFGTSEALSPNVQQICDDFFYWRLQDMPEYATFVGMHDYNEYLDDLSLSAFDYRYSNVTEFLSRLDGLQGNLTHEDDINIRVLRDELQTYLDGEPFKNYLIPLSNLEGVQVDFMRLLGWMPQFSPSDYQTLITRMEKLPVQMNQIIGLMVEGQRAGIALSEYSMNRVGSQIRRFLTSDAFQSPIYTEFFSQLPGNFSQEEVLEIQDKALTTIQDKVTPSFEALYNYVSVNYTYRTDIGVTSLPNGTDLYQQLIRFHTDSDLSPSDIREIGYDEVERIEQLMLEIVVELGYNMTVQEFSEMIKNDPNNYYDTEEELIAAFEHIVYDIATPAIPMIFKNIPQAEIIVVADPNDSGAFYLTGTYDGSRPGAFYVGTSDIKSQPKYEMLTLSLHEGNPGHHLQGSHSIESPNIPFFRSFMEDRNYGHAPSRFPIRSFYAEGWGLYAESTGFDMNLFGDLLERYGHYSDEIFRACRLVVDTGMHALGMTRQEAIDYMTSHTAMTESDVTNQIDRYLTWPGQALSYKTGQLRLSAMRANAETTLGASFDIKDFHDVVLESVGPFDVVNEEVDLWVQSVLSGK